MRQKTTLEIDHVRRQTREMFERENKILQESKERADNERDKVEGKLRDTEQKYDLLMTELVNCYHELNRLHAQYL